MEQKIIKSYIVKVIYTPKKNYFGYKYRPLLYEIKYFFGLFRELIEHKTNWYWVSEFDGEHVDLTLEEIERHGKYIIVDNVCYSKANVQIILNTKEVITKYCNTDNEAKDYFDSLDLPEYIKIEI